MTIKTTKLRDAISFALVMGVAGTGVTPPAGADAGAGALSLTTNSAGTTLPLTAACN